MALTSEEEKRIQRIENALAGHTTGIQNLASKRQLSHILTLLQKENEELRTRIAALESQVNLLKK